MACPMTFYITDEERISALPFMLNILLVCKRLKEERAYIYFSFIFYMYIQLTLQTLTDTAQIQVMINSL